MTTEQTQKSDNLIESDAQGLRVSYSIKLIMYFIYYFLCFSHDIAHFIFSSLDNVHFINYTALPIICNKHEILLSMYNTS